MHTRYADEEIVRRGRALYEERLREKLEPGNPGRLLLIEVDSGDYELGDDLLALGDRLRPRHPGGAFFSMRVGAPALYRIGGGAGSGGARR
jgi:hypothetical protein